MYVIVKELTPEQKAMAQLIAQQQQQRDVKQRDAERKLEENPYAQTKLTEYARQVAEMRAKAEEAERLLAEQKARMQGGM